MSLLLKVIHFKPIAAIIHSPKMIAGDINFGLQMSRQGMSADQLSGTVLFHEK
jgi:hypothetical protein